MVGPGMCCCVVAHGWAEDDYVPEDATVEALKEIEYKVFPQPVCPQIMADWGYLSNG